MIEPLLCKSCGGAVPLLDAPSLHCPFCGHDVQMPAAYRRLFADRARDIEVRKEAEREFAIVAQPPPPKVDRRARLLVLFLPALAALVVIDLLESVHDHLAFADLLAFIILPAFIPGIALWMWSAAIQVTLARFSVALASGPIEKGVVHCRQCGAPIAQVPETVPEKMPRQHGPLFATCLYCGTDNLLTSADDADRRIKSALDTNVKTLAGALELLRLRKKFAVWADIAACTLLLLFSVVVHALFLRTIHAS